tara:strand:+ start:101 stop:316 length:216 start_codon:yes stop_codon:yes gene_type:complete
MTQTFNEYVDENYKVVSWELDHIKKYTEMMIKYPHTVEQHCKFIVELIQEIKDHKWTANTYKAVHRIPEDN